MLISSTEPCDVLATYFLYRSWSIIYSLYTIVREYRTCIIFSAKVVFLPGIVQQQRWYSSLVGWSTLHWSPCSYKVQEVYYSRERKIVPGDSLVMKVWELSSPGSSVTHFLPPFLLSVISHSSFTYLLIVSSSSWWDRFIFDSVSPGIRTVAVLIIYTLKMPALHIIRIL